MIGTISGGVEMETFGAGTLAGAGCFRCEACGFAVALHELDEVPDCPNCGGEQFKRSSLFAEHSDPEPYVRPAGEEPDWLGEARDALVSSGDYLAYEDEEAGRVRVVPLQQGWTRIGRSMAAHIRFDDPTVSRRHALLHRQEDVARILDDRSLNGVFLNGDRVDWHELSDGDEIAIGRFQLFFIGLTGDSVRGEPTEAGTAVG
jgi:predicted RNA-binding Zn-ribbon protein involved in translation (DUF1610 family)